MFHDAKLPMTTASIERAEKALQRMLEWIGRHDLRSGATMGITVAMLGALGTTPSAVIQALTQVRGSL